ncbi:MAG: GAF domain-containing protein, partial [Betaproteobacteria bacterium]
MSETKSGSPANATEEITALIEVLHTTGQRIEDLTGGEVDAVADRTGRTFLLRRAQDRLRFSKAARQTAILNALPAHVALLDTEGVITSVNEAWQRFASANMLQGPADAIGLNYLGICESARGEGSSEAAHVAAGIRAVLDGSAKRFSIEYPCHSPAEQRWFLLTVTPLSNERLTGAVVMHLDVTQQRQLAQELEIERSRLVAAQQVAKVGSWETDLTTLSVIWSRETHRIHETDPATFRPSHQAFLSLIHPEDRALVDEAFARSLDQRAACAIEHRLLLPDGRIKFVEERWQVLFDQQGKAYRAIGTCQDVTEKARANAHIRRLNRVYAVLSGINSLIVRVHDRNELFREACRIAVEVGAFRMALICTVDRDSMKIVPVASAGKGVDLLAAIKRALASSDDAPKTMVALAVRDKKPVLSNDSQNDPRLIFGKQYSESGVRSLAVLPLLVAGEAVGVLALYSRESGFFVEEELTLLTELSGDIAFAIDHIGQQERLDYLTYYDVLTGLATRTLFL